MSLIATEYMCPEHGRFDSLERRPAPDDKPCPTCGANSAWCISAPLGRVRLVEPGSRARTEKIPRGYLDTSALGEGQSFDDWKADRRRIRHEERKREIKDVMS